MKSHQRRRSTGERSAGMAKAETRKRPLSASAHTTRSSSIPLPTGVPTGTQSSTPAAISNLAVPLRPQPFAQFVADCFAMLQGIWGDIPAVGRRRRPWGEFFEHFKEPESFSYKILSERIEANLMYYRYNYISILSNISAAVILTHPAILLGAIALLVLSKGYPGDNTEIQLGEWILARDDQLLLARVGIILTLVFSGAMKQLLLAAGAGSFLCLLHMAYRPQPRVVSWSPSC
ncbi:unnamed protein product [Chrysoparadoxa australica]